MSIENCKGVVCADGLFWMVRKVQALYINNLQKPKKVKSL